MLTNMGFRGVNLVDPACITRTQGLDKMVICLDIKRPAVVQFAEETQPPVEAAHGESGGREQAGVDEYSGSGVLVYSRTNADNPSPRGPRESSERVEVDLAGSHSCLALGT